MFTADLHSHILPGIDDGARDPEISLALLQAEADQGIRHVVLSPHFHPRRDKIEEFLPRREESFGRLSRALDAAGCGGRFDLRTAAEIRYSPALTDLPDLESLCVSGTKVLLVEFSFTAYPEFVREVFYRLQMRGFVLLLAHIERYPWLRKDTDLLYDLVCGGVYTQVNADSVVKDREARDFIRRMLDCGLVHGIGSDAHDPEGRPPRLKEAAAVLGSLAGPETVPAMDACAGALLAGSLPLTETPSRPRVSFWERFRK